VKKIIFVLCIIFATPVFSQDSDSTEVTKKSGKVRLATLVINLNNCFLNTAPSGMENRAISPGADAYLGLNLPLRSTGLYFAVGTGFSSLNYHYNLTSLNSFFDANGNTKAFVIPDSVNYLANKLSVTYVDIPVELLYSSQAVKRSKAFKAAIGFKGGFLVNSHIKYKNEVNGEVVKSKVNHIKNIEKFRYGVTARLAYGPVGITAFYSLTGLFQKNKLLLNNLPVKDMSPLTVGITFNI
jgi:hypothetical protein